MKNFRFRKFPVYKDARLFAIQIKTLIRSLFPKSEDYGLSSQVRRAVDSVVLNIAEGSDKNTDKEFAKYLNISCCSLNEVVACLDIAFDCKYIDQEMVNHYLEKASLLSNQITAFRRSILRSIVSG
jgi:four helix bundle protein